MGEAIERYLEEFEEKRLWHPSSETIEPLAKVYVEHREVIVTVDILCADREGVKVKFLNGNTLDFRSLKIIHRGGRFTRYYVRIELPVLIEPSRATITCYRGVLEIRAPRKDLIRKPAVFHLRSISLTVWKEKGRNLTTLFSKKLGKDTGEPPFIP